MKNERKTRRRALVQNTNININITIKKKANAFI